MERSMLSLILSSSHPLIFSSPHPLILSSSHPLILSSPHPLIPSSSHPVILSSPQPLIPSSLLCSTCLFFHFLSSFILSSRPRLLEPRWTFLVVSFNVRIVSLSLEGDERTRHAGSLFPLYLLFYPSSTGSVSWVWRVKRGVQGPRVEWNAGW